MTDETHYRLLLERAQGATDAIEAFLKAIAQTPHGQTPELEALISKINRHLGSVQSDLDQLWDLFKRLPISDGKGPL